MEKSAGAVVYYRSGDRVEYLLVLSTYWEFPKGLVEPNESEQEAAVREVGEETGLQVDLLPNFREEISYFYRRADRLVKKQVVYFVGRAAERAARVSWEHHEARWVEVNEALELLKYENSRALLQNANERVMREQRAEKGHSGPVDK
ncbi:MAG: bis(5'-nucleosyl)-tetraphosphatase [Rudaea sp.]